MRWVKFLFSFLLTIAFIWALLVPIGPVTFSAGAFFNPFEGFWQNAEPLELRLPATVNVPGLEEEVEVVFDERRVPHIFAKNTRDLMYMQGYLTARDRLWQMEFQIFAAAGRLTELVGRGPNDAVLKMDRQARRQGMVTGAKASLEAMMASEDVREVLEAYAAGVNAYIAQLDRADLPLEYKLLNYQPEPWSPLKTALFLKYMANDLASRADDIRQTNNLAIWGEETFKLLFPDRAYASSPIVPTKEAPRFRPRNLNLWDFEPEPVPERPANYAPDSLLLPTVLLNQPEPNTGSNNWAVAPEKSLSGRPMLANDPHLGLNLPAIWYEVQLNAPGLNVYGASLPGAPGVIIGFNDSIAWGVTNAGRDVMDFYRIQFRDSTREEYLFDGRWMKTSSRIDTFQVKGGEVFYDTVLSTHLGPVMFDHKFGNMPVPLAVKWMAHEPTNDALAFLKLNRANNYEEYAEAIRHHQCPAQNFVFASAAGDIAIWQQGKFVNSWPDQGKFVLDGSKPEHMWNQFIPQAHNPHSLNPERGFVSSANQHPADPTYPYQYVGSFEDFRNRRINELLARDSLTVEDMKAFQLDNFSYAAADVLPTLLNELDSASMVGLEREVYQLLKTWDYFYHADALAPTAYERWWGELYRSIWADEFTSVDVPLQWPDYSTTIGLLRDSLEFRFYDDVETVDTLENRTTLAQLSFRRAVKELEDEYGGLENWAWAEVKQTQVVHLSRQRAFSRLGLPIGGNRHILNAASKRNGPSWRMVVALGNEVEAYGIYPGGQSGNVGSAQYDAFIDDWAAGNYYRLQFMQGPDDHEEMPMAKQRYRPTP